MRDKSRDMFEEYSLSKLIETIVKIILKTKREFFDKRVDLMTRIANSL